jgi:CLIP-associating protein 1/2
VEALIATLKTCLRISNHHLTTATLSTIQALIHRITNGNFLSVASTSPSDYSQQPVAAPDPHRVHELRYALLAFLPNGGVIDRLGEPRETARAIAKDTLVLLGAAAFKFSGPAPASTLRQKDHKVETLFVVLDKFLKDVGFGSKVWRVREQVRRLPFRSLGS